MAQGTDHKEPIEDTCLEYLVDDDFQKGFSLPGIKSLADKSTHREDSKEITKEITKQLDDKIMILEQIGESTKQEVQILRAQTETLESEMRVVRESSVIAKTKQHEAETVAKDMIQKRDEINLEKNTLENRVQQMFVAQEKDKQNRASMKNAYHDKKITELRRTCNTQNSKLKMLEEGLRQLEEENFILKKKNNFLEETLFAVSSTLDQEQNNQQLQCFSCKQNYSAESNDDDECTFHPLPGLPPNSWHRWRPGPGENYRKTKYAGHRYWPCCNTLSMKRPDGCCRGQHHQKWEMDVVMKRVMLSQDFLEKMGRMEDICRII